MESIVTYGTAAVLFICVLFVYIYKHRAQSKKTIEKIHKAKELGLHEPITLHPVVNHNICIGSGACIQACPEKDILGIIDGKAVPVNTSRCVGHGACFQACPVQAITLCIGTEQRGVDLPHLSKEFESTVPMLFVVGELGGMGLIKNAVEQGRQAVLYLAGKLNRDITADYDIAIVGAGPAGIAASLGALEKKLTYITFEQDTIGGTVASFPREKLVMTSPMNIPLYGKIKLSETSKTELIGLWNEIIKMNSIRINENERVDSIAKVQNIFTITTSNGAYTARAVILAIGRRGSPRKLGAPGDEKDKVYYRLIEPELIHDKDVLVVGGGDSAIEAARLLTDSGNRVTIAYRSNTFSRIKPLNLEKINAAQAKNEIQIMFNTQVTRIDDTAVELTTNGNVSVIKNDLVYVFIGGELPTAFLEKIGIKITTKHGDALLSH